MTNWYIGTMGFSYGDWQGPFYPTGLPARSYLSHYANHFNAVEIDSTFYGVPRGDVVARWREITPPEFRFCAKVPRTVTHELGLKGVGAREVLSAFLDSLGALEGKLGVVLIQLPPSFTTQEADTLADFLADLPDAPRFAVEVRHSSWHVPATAELLRKHGVCWAATDYRDLPARVHLTAPFLYLRWIGWHGRYPSHEEERVDRTERLQAWVDRLLGYADRVDAVFGFTNNDYAGHAPATANRVKSLLGLPTENLAPPRQGRLFDDLSQED